MLHILLGQYLNCFLSYFYQVFHTGLEVWNSMLGCLHSILIIQKELHFIEAVEIKMLSISKKIKF